MIIFSVTVLLSKHLIVNGPPLRAGPLVWCCGRCWQERCPTRMWIPPLSSGELATTACICLCPRAVQTASNCCWGSAGECAWRMRPVKRPEVRVTGDWQTVANSLVGIFILGNDWGLALGCSQAAPDLKVASYIASPSKNVIQFTGDFLTGTVSRGTGLPSDRFSCTWTSLQQTSCRLLKKHTFNLR